MKSKTGVSFSELQKLPP